ncbi:hypothetical protein [Posidoniimonas corsicana]|nr:hypothetical protein [Posidoniimonas corsicana]
MNKLSEMDGVILYDALDLADILDARASEVRGRLQSDPQSLPLPIVFSGVGLVRWPHQQIAAWVKAGCPRDYRHAATEFVPRSISQFHNAAALATADPTSPVADLRAVAALLDGEPAVTYPKD